MRHLRAALTVVGAVTILVLAGNTISLAVTGKAFILGKANSAGTLTTLTRTTSGTALKITTKSAANAPLTVNGHGKVANLNADQLDGLDSSTLRNHSYVFTKAIALADAKLTLDVDVPVPVGSYQFSYSAYLPGAGGGANVYCEMLRTTPPSGRVSYALTEFTPPAGPPGLSGSGVITKRTGDTITLECGASNPFSTSDGIPIQVVMTPTTVVSTTALP